MADLEVEIEGDLTLSETQDRCNLEQGGGFQLTNIQHETVIKEGRVFQINRAQFDEKLDDRLTLTFIELGGNDPEKLQQQKEDEGFTAIKGSKIFVENHITEVMVFGK